MRSIIKIKQTIFILFLVVFAYFPFNNVTNSHLKVAWIKEIISYFYQIVGFLSNGRVLLILITENIWKLINIWSRNNFKFIIIWRWRLPATFFIFYFLVGLGTFEFFITLSYCRKMCWQTNFFDIDRFLLNLI
jgi:hypothetical protein